MGHNGTGGKKGQLKKEVMYWIKWVMYQLGGITSGF